MAPNTLDSLLAKACATPEGRLKAQFVLTQLEEHIAPALAKAETKDAALEALEKWSQGEDELRKALSFAWLSRARAALAPAVGAATHAAGAVKDGVAAVKAGASAAASTVSHGVSRATAPVRQAVEAGASAAEDVGAAAGRTIGGSRLYGKRMRMLGAAGGGSAQEMHLKRTSAMGRVIARHSFKAGLHLGATGAGLAAAGVATRMSNDSEQQPQRMGKAVLVDRLEKRFLDHLASQAKIALTAGAMSLPLSREGRGLIVAASRHAENTAGELGAALGRKFARSRFNARRMGAVSAEGGMQARESTERVHAFLANPSSKGRVAPAIRELGPTSRLSAASTPAEAEHARQLDEAFAFGAEHARKEHIEAAAKTGRKVGVAAFRVGVAGSAVAAGAALSDAQRRQRSEAGKHSHDNRQSLGLKKGFGSAAVHGPETVGEHIESAYKRRVTNLAAHAVAHAAALAVGAALPDKDADEQVERLRRAGVIRARAKRAARLSPPAPKGIAGQEKGLAS